VAPADVRENQRWEAGTACANDAAWREAA
jgi:hypothetical protein